VLCLETVFAKKKRKSFHCTRMNVFLDISPRAAHALLDVCFRASANPQLLTVTDALRGHFLTGARRARRCKTVEWPFQSGDDYRFLLLPFKLNCPTCLPSTFTCLFCLQERESWLGKEKSLQIESHAGDQTGHERRLIHTEHTLASSLLLPDKYRGFNNCGGEKHLFSDEMSCET